MFILYTKISDSISDKLLEKHLKLLPEYISDKIVRLKRWEDRQATLLGKLLLNEGLKLMGSDYLSWNDIVYEKNNRPFFRQEIDFNISHAGEYVACAISKVSRLGLDLEEIKEINIYDFESFFSDLEWKSIISSAKKYYMFYYYWTRKEAVLKANGIGIAVKLEDVCVYNDNIAFDSEHWILKQVTLEPNYVCHIATTAGCEDPIELKKISSAYFLNN